MPHCPPSFNEREIRVSFFDERLQLRAEILQLDRDIKDLELAKKSKPSPPSFIAPKLPEREPEELRNLRKRLEDQEAATKRRLDQLKEEERIYKEKQKKGRELGSREYEEGRRIINAIMVARSCERWNRLSDAIERYEEWVLENPELTEELRQNRPDIFVDLDRIMEELEARKRVKSL